MEATGGSGASATQYDVFLSFRWPDTGDSFTDCLFWTMDRQGIVAYRGSEELHAGDRIDDLLTAAGNSKICILVLSKSYASSPWCLHGLDRVMELNESTGKPEILPIFFDVMPRDVNLRTELYQRQLLDHEKRHGAEITQRCKAALRKVALIRGWEVERKPHGEVIELVVKKVLLKLKAKQRPLDSKSVGVDEQVEAIRMKTRFKRGSANANFRGPITSWKKGEMLGSGSFGVVYEGLTDDGHFFAVKEVSLLEQEGKKLLCLEREISLLCKLQHDNIVHYYGTQQDDKNLYVFLELMTKGSLQMLYNRYELSYSQASGYTRQIVNGLMYLHDRDVMHRDIKCANILVHANGFVKLADFGLAKEINKDGAKSSRGTYRWMAPEVIKRECTSYGVAADIWSLGCTVLEMLTRQYPYSSLEDFAAYFRIGRGELPPVPDSLPRDARDFILRCLQVNPNNRPSAAQLQKHPFINLW